jgi:pyridoxal phosphate enzyme (YggS family)
VEPDIAGADIAGSLARLEERILAACLRCGRKREEVSLMGVSKFHPLEAVEEAWKAGVTLFGESRVREGAEKFAAFREKHPEGPSEGPSDFPIKVHLIGSLQRNKAKAAASFFDCIQSVDRESLIEELGKISSQSSPENRSEGPRLPDGLISGRKQPLMILLEFHTGEESKAGFPDLDSLFRGAEKALSWPGLKPAGLMTMAPFTGYTAAVRASFRALAKARGELEKRFGPVWSCLSMGMTGDFETAIEEGSTLIRIGTAIFGERRL